MTATRKAFKVLDIHKMRHLAEWRQLVAELV